MSIKQCEDRLLDRGLRPTPARILTLRKLSELEYPVSLLELETMLDTLDKSTISRSLAVLLKRHAIHSFGDLQKYGGTLSYRRATCTFPL